MNKKKSELSFDILIVITLLFELLFGMFQNPLGMYMATFAIWVLIVCFALNGKGKRASLICFEITFFVFLLGGSFFSYLIDGAPLFEFEDSILIHTYLVMYVSQFVLYFSYRISETRTKGSPEIHTEPGDTEESLLKIRYYALGIMILAVIPTIVVALDNIGYVTDNSYEDLYLRTSNNLPFIVNKLSQLFSVSFFLYLSTKPKKKQAIWPIALYLGVRGITLATGRRTDFMLAVMVVFFYFIIRSYQVRSGGEEDEVWFGKKEKVLMLILLPILILVLVNVNNMRSGEGGTLEIGKSLLSFFQDQGVSITVIERGKKYQNVIPKQWYLFGPIIDFFKYNEVTQLFFKFKSYGAQTVEQALYGASFADTLSYLVIPYDYSRGHGLGSCYIAEAYQTLGMFGVVIVNMIYGWVLNFVNSRYGRTIAGSTFAMFALMRLFYAPRSTALSFLSSTFTITNLIIIYGGILVMKRIHVKKISISWKKR